MFCDNSGIFKILTCCSKIVCNYKEAIRANTDPNQDNE